MQYLTHKAVLEILASYLVALEYLKAAPDWKQ